MNQYLITRRRFLKESTVAAAGVVAVSHLGSSVFGQDTDGVAIVVDPDDTIARSAPPQWAISQLQQALEGQGKTVKLISSLSQASDSDLVVVASSGAAALTGQIGASVPASPESLAVLNGTLSGRGVVLVSGSDARGMVYAILELTDRVLYHTTVQSAFSIPAPIVEQTFTQIRSIVKHFANTTEDLPAFRDKAYWDEYLTMLASERFNRFAWGGGQNHNYSLSQSFWIPDAYFCFIYPYFVSTGGVSVTNVTAQDQQTNLEMLKYISDGCALRGLNFTLQIWNSNFKVTSSNYTIQGLSGELGGSAHETYSHDALGMILEACPNITGLTFRSHYEGGIPETNSRYWEVLFSAVTPFINEGRKIEIDLHGKNIAEFHLDAVIKSGAVPIISPKKTAEQSGLPYHHASIRNSERNSIPNPPTKLEIPGSSRYGYWSLLQEGRRWRVLHRLWPGTQKHLIWGDPAFAAGFGHAAHFCDSDGIETYEPLAFHGRGGQGDLGDRNSYADTSLKPAKYDFHKFLYTFRVWGRCVYNPNTDPEGWRRLLRKNFGAGALSMEESLGNASRILFMVSSIQAASASWIDFWPEVFEGLNITDGMPEHKDCLNPQRLTSPFDPQLFAIIDDYAEALLKNTENELDKYTPLEVASWWERFSETALAKLSAAKSLVPNSQDPEFRRYEVDIKIMANLGLHFAKKWRAAILYSIYRKTNDSNAKTEALAMFASAINYWTVASQAGSVYKKLPYNLSPAHWSDRLEFLNSDRDAMSNKVFNTVQSFTTHPGSAPAAIAAAKSTPVRPAAAASHTPPPIFSRGSALDLTLSCDETTQSAKLYYRHVYQAENWNVTTMSKSGNQFTASIPAGYTQTDFPLQYYFALKKGSNSAVLFPGLNETLANQPYFHVRSVAGSVSTAGPRETSIPEPIANVSVIQRASMLEVHYFLNRLTSVTAGIYSLQGRRVVTYTRKGQKTGLNVLRINLKGTTFSPGKYVLRIASEGTIISRKISIIK